MNEMKEMKVMKEMSFQVIKRAKSPWCMHCCGSVSRHFSISSFTFLSLLSFLSLLIYEV